MLLADGRVLPDSALAETTPVLSNGYFYAQDGLQLADLYATYAQLYRSQAWVATVVDKVASAFSRLPINVWDTTPATGKKLANDSDFGRLMAQPNRNMSPVAFWRWVITTHEIYGEAFLIKQRDKQGRLVNLLPMHPSRTIIKRDIDGHLTYRFTLGIGSAGILDVPAEDVVPFNRYNPNSAVRGLSRLEALRMTLLNEDAARRATASFWEKGARPSVMLKVSKQLSDPAIARLERSFANKHGGVDNVGKAVVLEEGMDATIVQLSPEEMQYIEGRRLNREEVCAVYDMPPPAVHILDRATFSNITEQLRMLYRDTMAPRVIEMESVIDTYIRPEFTATHDQAATFDMNDVMRGDFETRAEASQKLIQSGVMKPAEARVLFDLPDAGPEADALYGNAALVPLGTSDKSKTATDGTLLPTPLKTEQDTAIRSIAGALGREQTPEDMHKAAERLIAQGTDPELVTRAMERIGKRRKEQA